jgi:hypothetical protein
MYLCCCPLLLLLPLLGHSTRSIGSYDDDVPYDLVLWPGTHNTAVNLGQGTVARPGGAVGGRYPSAAHLDYQYTVMDQRLSTRDQLEQGIRVLDFEVAALESTKWTCAPAAAREAMGEAAGEAAGEEEEGEEEEEEEECTEHVGIHGRCFASCPFIVSHGSVDQSIGLLQGYTFPGPLFSSVAAFVRANPREIITIFMIATHGNSFPGTDAIVSRFNMSGLLPHIYNVHPTMEYNATFQFPTLGDMRKNNRTVLVIWGGYRWNQNANYPAFTSSLFNATGFSGAQTCIGTGGRGGGGSGGGQQQQPQQFPCNDGWDSVTFPNLSPTRAALSSAQKATPASTPTVFVIENLSSRRGRANDSFAYNELPNEWNDLPFQFGGNPAQASLAANYDHIVLQENAFKRLIAGNGTSGIKRPNWVLVDFFNTTNVGAPASSSRSLRPNPNDGLVRACHDITMERVKAWRASK